MSFRNRGGRNNRLNWDARTDGTHRFGDYAISLYAEGARYPWVVSFRGEMLLRGHGRGTGYRRFGSVDAAKRWVESRK